MSGLQAETPLAPLARELRTGDRRLKGYLDDLRSRFESIEPDVRAFLPAAARWDRLEREAGALEANYSDPGTRPPLFGVPVGVKDIFHVEGFETKAGSDVPPSELTGSEAPTVTTLKDAGALILGKTVTTEFAYFEPGPTRNPHNTDHTPGGSSSGSAAAVAAGLSPLALGTQTIGSVIRPAAFTGVVGVKPSFDRLSVGGVIPVSSSLDQVGYFTQDLPGAILAAGVLYPDWRAGDEPPHLETIGVVEGPYLSQAEEAGKDHFHDHVNSLESAGYEIRGVELFENIGAVNDRHEKLMAAEMALAHSDLYPKYEADYADETAALIENGRSHDIDTVCDWRGSREALRTRIHETMDEQGLDIIVSPSAPGPAPQGIDTTGDPVMNLPWTHAGLPTVSIPASKTSDGLPIGLQCVTRYGADEWLLSWSQEIRSALQ